MNVARSFELWVSNECLMGTMFERCVHAKAVRSKNEETLPT